MQSLDALGWCRLLDPGNEFGGVVVEGAFQARSTARTPSTAWRCSLVIAATQSGPSMPAATATAAAAAPGWADAACCSSGAVLEGSARSKAPVLASAVWLTRGSGVVDGAGDDGCGVGGYGAPFGSGESVQGADGQARPAAHCGPQGREERVLVAFEECVEDDGDRMVERARRCGRDRLEQVRGSVGSRIDDGAQKLVQSRCWFGSHGGADGETFGEHGHQMFGSGGCLPELLGDADAVLLTPLGDLLVAGDRVRRDVLVVGGGLRRIGGFRSFGAWIRVGQADAFEVAGGEQLGEQVLVVRVQDGEQGAGCFLHGSGRCQFGVPADGGADLAAHERLAGGLRAGLQVIVLPGENRFGGDRSAEVSAGLVQRLAEQPDRLDSAGDVGARDDRSQELANPVSERTYLAGVDDEDPERDGVELPLLRGALLGQQRLQREQRGANRSGAVVCLREPDGDPVDECMRRIP